MYNNILTARKVLLQLLREKKRPNNPKILRWSTRLRRMKKEAKGRVRD